MENLPRKNIVFVIDSLNGGGAENLVLNKIKFLRKLGSYNIECIKLQKAIHLKNMFTTFFYRDTKKKVFTAPCKAPKLTILYIMWAVFIANHTQNCQFGRQGAQSACEIP